MGQAGSVLAKTTKTVEVTSAYTTSFTLRRFLVPDRL